jgi:hypothetical protein
VVPNPVDAIYWAMGISFLIADLYDFSWKVDEHAVVKHQNLAGPYDFSDKTKWNTGPHHERMD